MDDNEEWSGVAAEATLAKFNAWHDGVRGLLSITRHSVTWTAERSNTNGETGTDTDSYSDDNDNDNVDMDLKRRILMNSIEMTKLTRNGTIQIFVHYNHNHHHHIQGHNDNDDGDGLPVSFTPLRREDGKIARKLINKISKDRVGNSIGSGHARSVGSPRQDANGSGAIGNVNGTPGSSSSSQPTLKKHRRKLSKRRLSYRNANAVDPAEEAAEMANFAKKYPIHEAEETSANGGNPGTSREYYNHKQNRSRNRNRNEGRNRYSDYNYNDDDIDDDINNDIDGSAVVARWKMEWRKIVDRVNEESRGTAAKWLLSHSLDISVCVVAIFALVVTIATLAMADVLTLRIRLLGVAVSSISS